MKKSIIYKKCNIGEVLDKLSPSPENIDCFVEIALNKASSAKLNDDFTMEHYISHCTTRLNDHIISGTPTLSDTDQITYMERFSSRLPVVLYCGINEYIYKLMRKNAKMHPDTDLYADGMIHGSIVKGKEYRDNYNLRILIPAGSKVLYLGNAGYPEDVEAIYETVIQTGARLRILSRDPKYINCELLSTN